MRVCDRHGHGADDPPVSIAITPERYNLQVGDIAYTTITASKDVVDEIATKRNRDDAANQVEPTYLFKGVTAEVMHTLTSVLTQANTVQQYGKTTLDQHALITCRSRKPTVSQRLKWNMPSPCSRW